MFPEAMRYQMGDFELVSDCIVSMAVFLIPYVASRCSVSLVGRQEGHLAYKTTSPAVPKVSVLGDME